MTQLEKSIQDVIDEVKKSDTQSPIKTKMTEALAKLHDAKELVGEYVSENSKPKWDDYGEIEGYYVSSFSKVIHQPSRIAKSGDKNIWPTKELSEAALALSQLYQWAKKYNGGVILSRDHSSPASPIIVSGDYSRYLAWSIILKDAETRDRFAKDFADLIEIAKPLL